MKHFSDEEQYMESINYKKLFTQKIQHHEFIQKLDEFMEHHNDDAEDQDEQIMEILKYLTEWLVKPYFVCGWTDSPKLTERKKRI